MNRLNIEDYDLSYDFQFIRFMIDLLEPVIVFENKGMIIKQRINKKGKNQEVEISRNEYIKFIQYIFPMEIKDEIDRAKIFEKKILGCIYCSKRGRIHK